LYLIALAAIGPFFGVIGFEYLNVFEGNENLASYRLIMEE